MFNKCCCDVNVHHQQQQFNSRRRNNNKRNDDGKKLGKGTMRYNMMIIVIIITILLCYSSTILNSIFVLALGKETNLIPTTSRTSSSSLKTTTNIRQLVDEIIHEDLSYSSSLSSLLKSSSSIIGNNVTTAPIGDDEGEVVYVDAQKGSDTPNCSLNVISSCGTIPYALQDLKTNRGIVNTKQILLYLQSSIEEPETNMEVNCRGFDFSGINFSQVKISAPWNSPSVVVNCYGISDWVSDSSFNLTMSNIVWRNFKIPMIPQMESILIENSEIQNLTISQIKSVTIRNCRVTSNGGSPSTVHLNDIENAVIRETSFERMAIGYCISRISSKYYLENINVDNTLLIFFGFVGLIDGSNVKNSLSVVDSRFTASTMRVIEFSDIYFRNNTHSQNILLSNIPSTVANKFFSEYSHTGFSVTCLTVRSDLRVNNITVENMQTFGGVFIEGPGLYARFLDSIFRNNRNNVGGGAIHLRTVFRAFVQNVQFISNSVTSSNGKLDMDYIGGGAIYQYRSVLITTKCYFSGNSGGVFGGGVFSFLPLEYFSLDDNFFANTASYGGGYASMDTISVSTIIFTDTFMRGNNCTSSGGAIFTMSSEIALNYGYANYITGNNANLLGGGIFFIDSKPTFAYKGISSIFVNNYCKVSTDLADYSSFATNIQTSPSDFTLKPGTADVIAIRFYDMFGNQIPFTSNLDVRMLSNDIIYPEISPIISSGFEKRFSFTVYMRMGQFPTFNTSADLVIGMTNIPHETNLNFRVKLKACGNSETLMASFVKSSKLNIYYECAPNLALVVSLAVVACCCCGAGTLVCCIFLVFKFFKMRGQVKLLARKEKAEEELTKKLMDLQTLYNSELENKHSYKDWLIKLDDVELIKKVGEGGGGIVYLANWKKVPVALKTIKLEDEDLDSNDFEHEASLLSSIRHPNIVTFYGVCLSNSSKFMVTEFMHGGSLDTFIYSMKTHKKKISFSQKISILSNIASGMSYLHDRCIMHRDLKPGNILLSNELTAKITDFGLSKLYSTDSGSMTKTCTVGTLLYMAPEVLLGTNYDEKCDVYSFSIIMWQVLFEESSLFNSSYVNDPKYSSIMTETQKLAFKNLSEAYMIVPKMITEGLRLPLPSLPLSDTYVEYWISADCGNSKASVYKKDNYDFALAGMFKLIEECWNADVTQRPSFTRIVDRIVEFEKALQSK